MGAWSIGRLVKLLRDVEVNDVSGRGYLHKCMRYAFELSRCASDVPVCVTFDASD